MKLTCQGLISHNYQSSYCLKLSTVIVTDELNVCVKCGSVAEWLACWTQAQKGLGANRSRGTVG